MNLIRSLLFTLAMVLITPPFALLVLLFAWLPRLPRYRLISGWARIMLWLARVLLGIRHEVIGLEHLPNSPSVILSKHQSAWETMAFQVLFPPQAWVLKRELLWIPFFGWGLALFSPIAIDRSSRTEAFRRLVAKGRQRLDQGFWITIFPEGTRTAPGEYKKYRIGGAWLAVHAGATVVPVAHNAGLLWGRNAFIKRPGVINVEIGQPIDTTGMTPDAVIKQVEQWIEGRMQTLCPQLGSQLSSHLSSQLSSQPTPRQP